MDVVKAQGKNRKAGSADVALEYIRKLYRIEDKMKGLSPKAIYQFRQEVAKPIIKEFHDWLLEKATRTPPKGLLGKAITYALNQWVPLKGYLFDGRLSPDNNAAENAILPIVIEKTGSFEKHRQALRPSACLYSLIETAKVNGLEPHAYLRFIFDKLPTATTLEDYEALLPWNVKKLLVMVTAQKPLPLHILSQLMGHSDTKTTEVYLQVVGEEKRKMVNEAWEG